MTSTARRAAAAALALLASAQPAHAQPRRTGPEPRPDNPYMTYEDPKAWMVTANYFIYPDGRSVRSPGKLHGGPYSNLEFVVPLVESSGHAWSDPENELFPYIEVGISGGGPATASYRLAAAPGSPARYVVVTYNQPIITELVQATFETLIYCAETKFNEKAARDLPWPDAWPAEAAPWLERDPVLDLPGPDGSDPVADLLDRWTGGADPRQLPPVQLAKFLTGKVLGHVRSNGMNSERPVGRPPLVLDLGSRQTTFRRHDNKMDLGGMIGGVRVQNAAEPARSRTGSEHDLSNLLTAVLRRAGIPARTVIGVDKEERGYQNRLKSWVEFAMVAPDVKGVIWVPVDVRELKGSGRSDANWQQEWEHFGTSDVLRNTAPVAFHFHPPADYRSYFAPALFGIRFDSELPDLGTQGILYDINSLPTGGIEAQRRRNLQW